jgi:hypothetical protein
VKPCEYLRPTAHATSASPASPRMIHAMRRRDR